MKNFTPEAIAQIIVDMVVLTEPGAEVLLRRKIETALRQAYEGFDRLAAERDEADRRAGAAERELANLKQNRHPSQDAYDLIAKYEKFFAECRIEAGFPGATPFTDVWAEDLAALKEKRERDEAQ